MTALGQPSFAKGEISPELYGRTDTAAFKIALKLAKNVVIRQYGGAENRAGLQFIGPCKDHTSTVRLIPFEFKSTDAYVLEFGNLYMRVIRSDAYVTETALTGATATAADPVVVTKASHGLSDGDEVILSGFTEMTQVNTRRFIVASSTTNTFELTHQASGANIDGSAWAAETTGGSVAKIYELVTPYTTANLDKLKYIQSADVMTLTHPSYTIRELTRTANNAWTLTEPTFAPGQDHPTGMTVTVNTTGTEADLYKVTATNSETAEESLPALNNASVSLASATAADPVVVTATAHGLLAGDEIEINGFNEMTEVNGRRFTVANVNTNDFELEGEDGSGYAAETTGGTANLTFVSVGNSAVTTDNTISWTAVTGAGSYSVYKYDNGLYGWIGDTEETSFEDDNMAADLETTPPKARNPFLGTGNYPGCVSYYEQRRVFGGSTNNPDTAYYSQIGNQSNFSVHSPLQADDAITATLNSLQVNEIEHLVPTNDLIVLTSGSEWRVSAGSDNRFSADTIRQKPQSSWGAAAIQPFLVGNTVLYVLRNQAGVRSLGYDLTLDGYKGDDLTTFSSHFVENNTISDWAYIQDQALVLMVRDDGVMLALTFQPDQQVIAWSSWEVDGAFKSITSIYPESTSLEDTAYVVVERTIDGNTVQYVEKLHTRRFQDIRDCFFVDSGLTLDNPITITGTTAADPVVVTAPSHGLSNGDSVDISDITWFPSADSYGGTVQPDQLNNGRFLVANVTTNTFEITTTGGTGIDGSAFNAYKSGGKVRLAVTTLSGLDHLEGETVTGLADGNVLSDLVVTNGSITLPRAATRIHVGKRYVADMETLPIQAPKTEIADRRKLVSEVTVKFENSRGLFIGPSFTVMDEIKQRQFEKLSDPTALFTGPKTVAIPPEWDDEGTIAIRQRYPLPMSVLAIIPDIDVGD